MKFLFSPPGVAQFNAHLQKLPIIERFEMARKVDLNLGEWLAETFDLKDSPYQYFRKLNNSFKILTAATLAMAIENLVPVNLEKPKSSSVVDRSKLIRDQSSKTAEVDGEGHIATRGEVIYEIVYI